MDKKRLLDRLDDIAKSLEKEEHTLALMALGSVGTETDRIDAFSDLDFFAIVEDRFKQHFIDDLTWLKAAYPLAYVFKNTKDGYKVLFEDGIYAEFAVFAAGEMDTVTQPNGRMIWHRPEYKDDNVVKMKGKIPNLKSDDIEFAVNEALTNLYVGLNRVMRGERLSGYFYIESYAFSRILSIVHHFEQEATIHEDLFGLERRFEKHYPEFKNRLSRMLSGYDHIEESALAILDFLQTIYPINLRMKSEIESLIHRVKALNI